MAGLAATLGSGAMTNSIKDCTTKADVILVTGSNTSECHPIIANYIREAVMKHGTKLIVVDPKRIDLVDYADIWLQPKPGNNIAWINGFMNVIINNNLQDDAYINERTEGFDRLKEVVLKYTPEEVAKITGIPQDKLIKAATLYGKAEKASILYAMGITQHTTGTDNVKSLSNLALITGNIGKEGAGVNPLRGQNNVQGACDMGGLPNVYPGYQPVDSEENCSKFSEVWGSSCNLKKGRPLTDIPEMVEKGELKALYIMGENPMLSEPDLSHAEHAFDKLDFIVVQDIFFTETAQKADVVLPAACFAEKEGTFTNTERRVQRVRKAVNAPGDAKEDILILSMLASKLGANFSDDAQKVFEEIRKVTPQYAGISYSKIEANDGVCWPCPDEEHQGTPVLHTAKIARGKGLLVPIENRAPKELADKEYPFILTTGRRYEHYHTATMTRRAKALNYYSPSPALEINPSDAKKLGISDGEKIVVSSRRGSVSTNAKISNKVSEGVVFGCFHFSESAINRLTNSVLDPVAGIPEYKVCAVNIKKA